MDAPICRSCNTKHWSREPCPVRGVDERRKPSLVKRGKEPVEKKNLTQTESSLPKEPVKRWDKESWNAYMKEYMRKRRANKPNL